MIQRILIITFSVCFLLGGEALHGQDFNSSNLSTVKVDELSDGQIKQLIQRAEQSGMTESQMKSALISRGMPASELQKLERRIRSLGADNERIANTDRIRENNLFEGQETVFESLSLNRNQEADVEYAESQESRIYGSDLFSNENLTFEPNLNIPTPPDYQIGPGDEIIIDIWGASQQNYQLQVSPEGSIFIENLGPIQVDGLTIVDAKERILKRLTNIYAGLTGPSRNTYADVTLGNTRTINVHIMGEITMPGSYVLSAFSTIYNALYASGGPSETGSFRNIELIRNNRQVAVIDMYEFLINGTLSNNIRLQDQDIIKVNPYVTRVDITGEIKRPGLYELSVNESFNDLLKYTGGYTDNAYSRLISVYRKTDTERKIIDLEKDELNTFRFNNGDSIPVAEILDRFENRITIKGAVFRPGEYSLDNGSDLNQLLENAEGLREDAFLARALIYRTKDDLTLEVIPVNLRNVLNNTVSVKLHKDDIINVASIFDLREAYYFKITGDVNQPGTFPFIENTSLEDLIIMAGGLKESASLSRVEVARRIFSENQDDLGKLADIIYFDIDEDLEIDGNADRFTLRPFDQVYVRKSPGFEESEEIVIEGEVLYPGVYNISDKKERISDIIMRAGGLTEDAYPEGARLIRKVEINQEEREKALSSIMEETSDSLEFSIDNETEQAIGIELLKILENPGSKHDIFVQDGDKIEITKEIQTVRLTGALLYPISVRYDKSYTFKRYISMSGGFATDAKKGKSYVIYANGSVDRTNKVLFFNDYPKIEPGAEIVVPRKPEKERMTAQEAVGLSSALTSMALIIVTIINTIGSSGSGG